MKLIANDQECVNKLFTIFKNLKAITDSLVIYLDEVKGVYIQGLDRSQCCMCEIKLQSTWFNTFEFDNTKDIPTIGINTVILNKIMTTYTEGQSITLSTIGEADKLSISFSGTQGVLNKEYEVPLMNIEVDILAITEESRQIDVIMNTKQFVELVNQMQMFHDTLTMKFTEELLEMSAEGIEGNMKVNISLDDIIEYQIEEGLELKQDYAIQFIQMMSAFHKLSYQLELKFDTERPMEGKYVLGENSYMCFYIAPKMED